MAEKIWVVDDTPSRRFPIYTRGNIGEVFPVVVSPLTWPLYGSQAELGEDKVRVAAFMGSIPPLETATDEQLFGKVTAFKAEFRHLFARHILGSFKSTAARGLLAQ